MRLNYKNTIFIGFAFFSICAFWQVYDSIIPLILKQTFQVKETATGFVMAVDNILALFMLPFFGSLSDRVHTPLGKRMPFILGGTAIAVVAMIVIPYADNSRNFVLFIASLCISLIAMGTYRSPAVALMPDITPKPLRSKANAIINLMGAIGGVVSLLLMKFLISDGDNVDYMPIFIIVAAIMVGAVLFLLITVRENKLAAKADVINSSLDIQQVGESEKETAKDTEPGKLPAEIRRSLYLLLASVALWFMAYNAVTTAFSRYASEYLGLSGGGFADCLLIATGAAVISYIPIGFIATRFGRKNTIIAGIILMMVAFTCAFLYTEYHFSLIFLFMLVGIGWAAINVNSYPMVVEMVSGKAVGKFTGYYYTASMAAQIATPVLSGFLLEKVGYYTLFPYAAIFMISALITMSFVSHGDSRSVKKIIRRGGCPD